MTARLVPLGALVLLSAGCGAETVGSDESGRKTVRIESLNRYAAAGTDTHEVRSTTTYDYGNGRSEYVDPASGCRTITIGNQGYAEVAEAAGVPGGKRWVRYDGTGYDVEAEFEKTLHDQTQTTSDGMVVESSMILFATSSRVGLLSSASPSTVQACSNAVPMTSMDAGSNAQFCNSR